MKFKYFQLFALMLCVTSVTYAKEEVNFIVITIVLEFVEFLLRIFFFFFWYIFFKFQADADQDLTQDDLDELEQDEALLREIEEMQLVNK